MWDLQKIRKMNSPEEVEKARNRARSMNGIKSGVQEGSMICKPFVYADEGTLLASGQKSDLELAERRIRDGSGGHIVKISESSTRKPSHGGRVK